MVGRYFGRFDNRKTGPIAANKALPEADRLASIEKRQIAFANRLSAMADARSIRAERALKRFGINSANAPSAFREVQGGEGGPLIPLSRSEAALFRLNATLSRLDQLERTLMALPSNLPAMPVLLSSTFGVRSDPFTHGAAMHTGLDIKGAFAQPIYAAAAGRVIRVGPWSGYGNVVVIDHGHGIETRYGHLSGFTVRPGAIVHAGDQIARMGSTGRSTGNHLHFEVRINGRAVNPRPFLEASADVLEIKAGAGRRVADGVGRS
jgi:murein DD-endopeptidase MepM/ murein hydrolase activator NlpD